MWSDFDGWDKVVFSDEFSDQCDPNNSIQFVLLGYLRKLLF